MRNAVNPPTKELEWGGPWGAAAAMVGLPLVTLVVNVLCSPDVCELLGPADLLALGEEQLRRAGPHIPRALAIVVLWLLFHSLYYVLPLGSVADGAPLRTGKPLPYKINAFSCFIVCHTVAFMCHTTGAVSLHVLADDFFPLLCAATVVALVMSLALYLCSFRRPVPLLALGGNTGSPMYDIWVGRELNPRIGALDLKFMCELRPGLIGWSLLNWAFVARAALDGALTAPIVCIAAAESLYVADALYHEAGNLTMMDITTDGFGFMLCFGDLVWVPFLYTVKAKALAYHVPTRMSTEWLVTCVAVFALGYGLFRASNTQKDRFRRDPTDTRVAHLKTMRTTGGRSLLVSGYWGVCRHPNYVGDWLMTLALAALTGTHHAIPYFHPFYFLVLLIHRQLRDEANMRKKYGEDWSRYCARVPYRLVPYVY